MTISRSGWAALWLFLAMPAVAGPKNAPLATVFGSKISLADVQLWLAPDRVDHPLAVRQAGTEAVDHALALHGLSETQRQQVADRAAELKLAEAELQGGAAQFAEQVAAHGLSLHGWQQALQTKLAINAQLPADATQIADKAIEERYSKRWGRFTFPAQALVSEIAVPLAGPATADNEPARAAMIAAAERLQRGEPFSAIAKVYSRTPDAQVGGDRGWVSVDALDPAVRKVLAAAKVGQITPVVQSAWGFHVFWLRDRKPQRKLSLGEARPLVVAQLQVEKMFVARRAWLQSARLAAQKAGQLQWSPAWKILGKGALP